MRNHPLALLLLLLSTAGAGTTQPSSSDVQFPGAGGVQIAGTFELPPDATSAHRLPAVVILAGSGPVDRDGNVPPAIRTNLLSDIAYQLAVAGVASLRYDKRGMYANRAEQPADPAGQAAFYDWDHFVGDAGAALHWLADQPQIDPAHVGIVGHSEGGLLALIVASQQGGKVAALALLSTPGRNVEPVLADQLTALLHQQGATAEQTKFFLDANGQVLSAIRQTGQIPLDMPPGLRGLYPRYLGPYFKGLLAVDPVALAQQYAGPVLVMNGTKDVQVSPDRDAKALDAALSTRKNDDHETFFVPGASHHLKLVHGPDDAGLTGEVVPSASEKLVGWLAKKLQKP